MIGFACPQCSNSLKVRKELAGKKVKCPGCGQAIPVPLMRLPIHPARPGQDPRFRPGAIHGRRNAPDATGRHWRDGQALALSPDGHFNGTSAIGTEIVYVVQTDGGQETLLPAVFAQRFNWHNDPARVRPTGR